MARKKNRKAAARVSGTGKSLRFRYFGVLRVTSSAGCGSMLSTARCTGQLTHRLVEEMANETVVTVVGNLVADPELKFLESGASVANFTVASTPRRYDRQRDEWVDGDPTFFRCAIWREPAGNVAESLRKGQRVVVLGQLAARDFERADGSKGTSVELLVDEIGPSLRYATAVVTKTVRSNGAHRDAA